jgi:hypothetical protein
MVGEILSDMERATRKWKQQKIYLHQRANTEGIRLAEAKAREISGLVLQNAFDWYDYWKPHQDKATVINIGSNVADWIARLEQNYCADRYSPSLHHTWEKHYLQAYKRLPQVAALCTSSPSASPVAKSKPAPSAGNIFVAALVAVVATRAHVPAFSEYLIPLMARACKSSESMLAGLIFMPLRNYLRIYGG